MTKAHFQKNLLTSLAITALATPVFADGTVTTPPPPEIVIATPTSDWTGFYGGLTLGYGVGTYGNNANFPGDGEGDLDGSLFGAVVGYSFQNGNVVFGPELAFSSASFSGSESCVNPVFTCEVDFNFTATLRGNVGYLASPNVLIFGSLGITTANVDVFTDNGTVFGVDHDVTGYELGLGVEWAVTPNTHLRTALRHTIYADGDYQTDILYTGVDMDVTVLELGVIFRF